jgi:hypothetical protein
MLDDLIERIQAEIEVYERLAQINTSKSRMSSEFLVRMVESWRERWDRHQPGSATPVQPLPCRWCAMECEWPCPDALSVLREIGIEP